MQRRALGPLGSVSRLTLGGGGIGQVWGPTSRDEATATLKAAVEAGIDLIDTAPMYLNCEAIFGETFQGALPSMSGSPASVIWAPRQIKKSGRALRLRSESPWRP